MSKADDINQDNLIEEIDFKELSKNCKTEKDLASLTKQFMKNMIENMLKGELEEHIEIQGNRSKNGTYKKSVRSDSGKLDLSIPRDRNSSYKPQIIPKGKTIVCQPFHNSLYNNNQRKSRKREEGRGK